MPGRKSFITIVSGLPRSGTSMMMRMLESGGLPVLTDNIRTSDEDNPNGYYEFERVKKVKDDVDWLSDAEGKVVKMIYRLLYDLPSTYQYRVIFMKRNMDEVLRSQETMLSRQGIKESPISDNHMAKLFTDQIKIFQEWLPSQQHIRLLYADYNKILAEPQVVLEEIREFLGRDVDLDRMMEVVDPTLYRQRA